ncbi:MAG: EamA family transporter [Verrucomicrobiota bacterium]
MVYLLLVSLIWGFSFGLIKTQLAGIDVYFVAAARMALALPLFLPFLKKIPFKISAHLALIGAVQYGMMYCSYLYAFRYLSAYEIALFTILTPIYVTVIFNLWEKKFQPWALGMALLAVIGAAVIRYAQPPREVLTGFLLMQLSNLCFAWGQVAYRKLKKNMPELKDQNIFAWLYAGALLVTALAATWSGGWRDAAKLTLQQTGVLVYLGILASGLCFFWWNKGAVLSKPATLAVFNNAKIPLAVLCSLVFFGEKTDVPRLLIGGGIMLLAVILTEKLKIFRQN